MAKNINLFGHDRGLGDTVSRVIKTVTRGKIKECGGCKNSKQMLNRVLPYRNPLSKRYE